MEEDQPEEEMSWVSVPGNQSSERAGIVSWYTVPGTQWCIVQTTDGREMFYNRSQRISVWEKPAELEGRTVVTRSPATQSLDTSSLSLLADVALVGQQTGSHVTDQAEDQSQAASADDDLLRAMRFSLESKDGARGGQGTPEKRDDTTLLGIPKRAATAPRTRRTSGRGAQTHSDHSYFVVTMSNQNKEGKKLKGSSNQSALQSKLGSQMVTHGNPGNKTVSHGNQVVTHGPQNQNVTHGNQGATRGNQVVALGSPVKQMVTHGSPVKRVVIPGSPVKQVVAPGSPVKQVVTLGSPVTRMVTHGSPISRMVAPGSPVSQIVTHGAMSTRSLKSVLIRKSLGNEAGSMIKPPPGTTIAGTTILGVPTKGVPAKGATISVATKGVPTKGVPTKVATQREPSIVVVGPRRAPENIITKTVTPNVVLSPSHYAQAVSRTEAGKTQVTIMKVSDKTGAKSGPGRAAVASPSRAAVASPSRAAVVTNPGRAAVTNPVRAVGTNPGRAAVTNPVRAVGTNPGRAAVATPSRAVVTNPGKAVAMPGRTVVTNPSRAVTAPSRAVVTNPGRAVATPSSRTVVTPSRAPTPGRTVVTNPGKAVATPSRTLVTPRKTIRRCTDSPQLTPKTPTRKYQSYKWMSRNKPGADQKVTKSDTGDDEIEDIIDTTSPKHDTVTKVQPGKGQITTVHTSARRHPNYTATTLPTPETSQKVTLSDYEDEDDDVTGMEDLYIDLTGQEDDTESQDMSGNVDTSQDTMSGSVGSGQHTISGNVGSGQHTIQLAVGNKILTLGKAIDIKDKSTGTRTYNRDYITPTSGEQAMNRGNITPIRVEQAYSISNIGSRVPMSTNAMDRLTPKGDSGKKAVSLLKPIDHQARKGDTGTMAMSPKRPGESLLRKADTEDHGDQSEVTGTTYDPEDAHQQVPESCVIVVPKKYGPVKKLLIRKGDGDHKGVLSDQSARAKSPKGSGDSNGNRNDTGKESSHEINEVITLPDTGKELDTQRFDTQLNASTGEFEKVERDTQPQAQSSKRRSGRFAAKEDTTKGIASSMDKIAAFEVKTDSNKPREKSAKAGREKRVTRSLQEIVTDFPEMTAVIDHDEDSVLVSKTTKPEVTIQDTDNVMILPKRKRTREALSREDENKKSPVRKSDRVGTQSKQTRAQSDQISAMSNQTGAMSNQTSAKSDQEGTQSVGGKKVHSPLPSGRRLVAKDESDKEIMSNNLEKHPLMAESDIAERSESPRRTRSDHGKKANSPLRSGRRLVEKAESDKQIVPNNLETLPILAESDVVEPSELPRRTRGRPVTRSDPAKRVNSPRRKTIKLVPNGDTGTRVGSPQRKSGRLATSKDTAVNGQDSPEGNRSLPLPETDMLGESFGIYRAQGVVDSPADHMGHKTEDKGHRTESPRRESDLIVNDILVRTDSPSSPSKTLIPMVKRLDISDMKLSHRRNIGKIFERIPDRKAVTRSRSSTKEVTDNRVSSAGEALEQYSKVLVTRGRSLSLPISGDIGKHIITKARFTPVSVCEASVPTIEDPPANLVGRVTRRKATRKMADMRMSRPYSKVADLGISKVKGKPAIPSQSGLNTKTGDSGKKMAEAISTLTSEGTEDKQLLTSSTILKTGVKASKKIGKASINKRANRRSKKGRAKKQIKRQSPRLRSGDKTETVAEDNALVETLHDVHIDDVGSDDEEGMTLNMSVSSISDIFDITSTAESAPIVTDLIYVVPNPDSDTEEAFNTESVAEREKSSSPGFSPQIESYGTLISAEEWIPEPFPVQLIMNKELLKAEKEERVSPVFNTSPISVQTGITLGTDSQVTVDSPTHLPEDFTDLSVTLNPDFLLEEQLLTAPKSDNEEDAGSNGSPTALLQTGDSPKTEQQTVDSSQAAAQGVDSPRSQIESLDHVRQAKSPKTPAESEVSADNDSTTEFNASPDRLIQAFKMMQCSVLLQRLPDNIQVVHVAELADEYELTLQPTSGMPNLQGWNTSPGRDNVLHVDGLHTDVLHDDGLHDDDLHDDGLQGDCLHDNGLHDDVPSFEPPTLEPPELFTEVVPETLHSDADQVMVDDQFELPASKERHWTDFLDIVVNPIVKDEGERRGDEEGPVEPVVVQPDNLDEDDPSLTYSQFKADLERIESGPADLQDVTTTPQGGTTAPPDGTTTPPKGTTGKGAGRKQKRRGKKPRPTQKMGREAASSPTPPLGVTTEPEDMNSDQQEREGTPETDTIAENEQVAIVEHEALEAPSTNAKKKINRRKSKQLQGQVEKETVYKEGELEETASGIKKTAKHKNQPTATPQGNTESNSASTLEGDTESNSAAPPEADTESNSTASRAGWLTRMPRGNKRQQGARGPRTKTTRKTRNRGETVSTKSMKGNKGQQEPKVPGTKQAEKPKVVPPPTETTPEIDTIEPSVFNEEQENPSQQNAGTGQKRRMETQPAEVHNRKRRKPLASTVSLATKLALMEDTKLGIISVSPLGKGTGKQNQRQDNSNHDGTNGSPGVRSSKRPVKDVKYEDIQNFRAYECPTCYEVFDSKSKLIQHRQTHGKVRAYPCTVCNKAFYSLDNLKAHLHAHTGERPYSCDICCRGFKQNGTLTKHMLTHSQERQYKCKICGKAFKMQFCLDRHQIAHTSEKPYKCKICGKGFKLPEYVTIHQSAHSNEKPYPCSICNKRFNRLGTLKLHMLIHNEAKPFICTICDRGFVCGSSLKRHMVSHTKERRFKCGQCGMQFKLKWNLTMHSRVHSEERPHPCTVCGKAFKNTGDRTNHMRVHTDARPHKCSVCNKAFRTGANRAAHMRIHTGEKPYKCNVCEKSFREPGHLVVHKRVHTGERPYICPVCGKDFMQLGHRIKHQRTHATDD